MMSRDEVDSVGFFFPLKIGYIKRVQNVEKVVVVGDIIYVELVGCPKVESRVLW